MDARQYAALPDPFPMWRGGVLHGARIAYETWGALNAARDNALLLFTGLSPPAHAASSPADPSDGWWQGMVGPGLAIDSERFFVICVNSLGSCFGSTGPASVDPATGRFLRESTHQGWRPGSTLALGRLTGRTASLLMLGPVGCARFLRDVVAERRRPPVLGAAIPILALDDDRA